MGSASSKMLAETEKTTPAMEPNATNATSNGAVDAKATTKSEPAVVGAAAGSVSTKPRGGDDRNKGSRGHAQKRERPGNGRWSSGRDDKRPRRHDNHRDRDSGNDADESKENPDDLRAKTTLDVPLRKEYLLRVKRDANGKLELDTQGQPLYSDVDFIKKHTMTDVTERFHDGGEKGREDDQKRRKADERNFLEFDMRKALRKRGVVKFPRVDWVQDAWNGPIFDEGKLPNVKAPGALAMRGKVGAITNGPKKEDRKPIDMKGKLYLAPLTTVGNLPFRRVCKRLGADVTCGEMAMAPNILQGQPSEWALLRRHKEENLFGVQLAGSNPNLVARAAELVGRHCDVDFIELNAGCPIDLLFNKGGGCALMKRRYKLDAAAWMTAHAVDVPVGVKMRTGVDVHRPMAHTLMKDMARAGVQWVTVHGRSRKQRYSKQANWDYITGPCAAAAQRAGISLLGNGDVYHWQDAIIDENNQEEEKEEKKDTAAKVNGDEGNTNDVTAGMRKKKRSGIDTVMIARGALIKPWLFTEIKERRVWDIRSSERLDIYKQFASFGLEHWGADQRGVDTTRRFLLEWLSFLYRYVPVGLVERGYEESVTMAHRAPFFRGRDDLETLLGSSKATDWIRITELLLGKAPDGFHFSPRHKSNAWGEDAPLHNG